MTSAAAYIVPVTTASPSSGVHQPRETPDLMSKASMSLHEVRPGIAGELEATII